MFRNLSMTAASDWRLAGLLLFFVLFCAVTYRLFLHRRAQDFDALARLPLDVDGPDCRTKELP